jgi:hypothetical protein
MCFSRTASLRLCLHEIDVFHIVNNYNIF